VWVRTAVRVFVSLTLLGLGGGPVALLVPVFDVTPIIIPRGGAEPARVQVAAVSATANALQD